MNTVDYRQRYCVLGAGSSGLAVAKNLWQLGIPFDCLEREDTLGGNWCYGKPFSSVYESTHLISSKPLTEYSDFPMPEEYPDYPSHEQVWKYLDAYARHFGLLEHIEFNAAVERVEPSESGWEVRLIRGESRHYRGVVIANGHNWDPQWPTYPGEFAGISLHSSQYKTPDVLRGRRVLVVGGGNSGCDIAVEAAQNAAKCFHSVRRGYHYIPKYLSGKPADQVGERMLRLRMPLAVRRGLARIMGRLVLGRPENYGLPKPDHRLFETHPIINSQMLYYVGHGRIKVKPDIAELCGSEVRFTDGSREPIDVIVYATGFKISFPFIEAKHLNWRDGKPNLYLNVFHPQCDSLCVAGLIQPDSGQFGLVDCQAQLIARFWRALDRDPQAAERFRRLKAGKPADLGRGIRYVKSPRHLLEVEHFGYRKSLERLAAEFS
jgi:hypothetical protein